MKTLNKVLLLTGILLACNIKALVEPVNKKEEVHVVHKKTKTLKQLKYKGNYEEYLKAIAKLESSNNSHAITTYGKQTYFGKYQFSKSTLESHGVYDVDTFLSDETLQDSIMIQNLQRNSEILNKTIKEFSGKVVNGVYITKSGILAGAHLVGPGGVLAAFYPEKYNHPIYDGNGVTVFTYMIRFGNYNLRGNKI
jgi:hypothetical protein